MLLWQHYRCDDGSKVRDKKPRKKIFGNWPKCTGRYREASTQLSNGSHIEMASRSQICEFLHQDLNFGAFFILLDTWFIFFIALACKTEWCIGKYSCLGTRRHEFKSPYCQKSFFSFKSWWRNSKICDQDAISIWPPLDSWVNAILVRRRSTCCQSSRMRTSLFLQHLFFSFHTSLTIDRSW